MKNRGDLRKRKLAFIVSAFFLTMSLFLACGQEKKPDYMSQINEKNKMVAAADAQLAENKFDEAEAGYKKALFEYDTLRKKIPAGDDSLKTLETITDEIKEKLEKIPAAKKTYENKVALETKTPEPKPEAISEVTPKVKPKQKPETKAQIKQESKHEDKPEIKPEIKAAAKDTVRVGRFTDTVTGMEFIFVKGGCFQMGDTFGDGKPDEKPVHEVCVDDFYMGKYEVTQGQWKLVMGNDAKAMKRDDAGSFFKFSKCGDNCPVEKASWDDTQEFISVLNEISGKRYRLPTEAEWEYAARSGGKSEKWAGTSSESDLGDYAEFNGSVNPVGQKKPNGLGLYDMTSNVDEWCSDRYDKKYYNSSGKSNPKGPNSGSGRVLRGGNADLGPKNARTARRNNDFENLRRPIFATGFRIAVSSR